MNRSTSATGLLIRSAGRSGENHQFALIYALLVSLNPDAGAPGVSVPVALEEVQTRLPRTDRLLRRYWTQRPHWPDALTRHAGWHCAMTRPHPSNTWA